MQARQLWHEGGEYVAHELVITSRFKDAALPDSLAAARSIVLANWIHTTGNAQGFASIWGDVHSKDDKYALGICHQHLEKLVIHLDDKAPAGVTHTQYVPEFKGKELHIAIHMNLANCPQAFNADDKKGAGNIRQYVWDHLNDVGNIAFHCLRLKLENYEHSDLKSCAKYIAEKVGKAIPVIVHYDEIEKITGKSVWYTGKPEEPNRYIALLSLTEGYKLTAIKEGVGKFVADALGKEAFLEAFTSIHVHVAMGSTSDKHGPHEAKKNGKELHCHFILNEKCLATKDNGANWPKLIEALL